MKMAVHKSGSRTSKVGDLGSQAREALMVWWEDSGGGQHFHWLQ